jgi:hypothetical protein
MRTKFLILIVLLPFIAVGQQEKALCKSCSHKELHWANGVKCDEEKLRAYFSHQMRNDITNVSLCKEYADEFRNDNYLCKDLMPLEEFVSGTFEIVSITTKDGFYLDENNEFVPHVFYIIGFSCVDDSCSLPYGAGLVVCDINKFKESIIDERSVKEFERSIDALKQPDFPAPNLSYMLFSMNMRAYFDKDIWALKSDDGTVKTLLGDKPLVDLVYKKYLIPNIHIDRYYFETETHIDSTIR